MKVYIPTRDNIDENILGAIKGQTLPCEIEIVICNYDEKLPKRQRIATAKEECKQRALLGKDEFVIFHDSDILDLYNDNFDVMYKFLLNNKDYGAVSLEGNSKKHICDCVMMVRQNFLSVINFSLFSPLRVTCFSVMTSAKENGFKYSYVDEKIRIRHIVSLIY